MKWFLLHLTEYRKVVHATTEAETRAQALANLGLSSGNMTPGWILHTRPDEVPDGYGKGRCFS